MTMNAAVMPMMIARRRRGLLMMVASQPRRRYVHAVTMNTMPSASGSISSIAGPREIASPIDSPVAADTNTTTATDPWDAR
jgi:hypothetical protein